MAKPTKPSELLARMTGTLERPALVELPLPAPLAEAAPEPVAVPEPTTSGSAIRQPAGERPARRSRARASRGETMIRTSLDLDAHQQRFFKRFAFEAETEKSVVGRCLLAELESDPELRRRVQARIEQTKGS